LVATEDLAEALPSLLPRLWRFALRLTGDKHDAEDLLQRACVRGLERRHQLQPGTSALAWMFSIINSVWLNEIRARQLRARYHVPLAPDMSETLADPGALDPESDALHRQLIAAVNALPDAQRTVMLLITAEGQTYREVAQTLGIPIGTVMSRLSRARLTIGLSLNPANSNELAKSTPFGKGAR
jgi:RNA polymerase sigma-70 factor, ECF subfamily